MGSGKLLKDRRYLQPSNQSNSTLNNLLPLFEDWELKRRHQSLSLHHPRLQAQSSPVRRKETVDKVDNKLAGTAVSPSALSNQRPQDAKYAGLEPPGPEAALFLIHRAAFCRFFAAPSFVRSLLSPGRLFLEDRQ